MTMFFVGIEAERKWDHSYFERVIAPTGCLLYRLYDGSGRLLYVGISRSPVYRWRKHRVTKRWWPRVAYIGCEVFPSEFLALQAEVKAIRTEYPAYNRRSVVR